MGTRVRELVSNLIARIQSEDPRLGTLVAASSFRGWHKLANEQEVAQLFGGYELHALQDIAEISRVVLRPSESYDPPTNCVFLPTLGFGDAMTRPPNLDGKRRFELLQLTFDPSVARAEYVAALLSSEPGVRLRKAGATGTTIPHLSKDGLTDMRIPLPPFAAQERAVRSASLLASMEATVARLRHDLWRRPEDAHNVLRELEHAVQTDPVDRWIEALPYPLASILQHYAAQRDPSTQVERLLHFFEATAQFSCAVLLSILLNGPSNDDADWATIGQATRRQRLPFALTAFGLWTTLGTTLSHEIQRLSGIEHLRHAMERGAGPATELVRQLADEQLWHILGSAKSIRNERAHGGISPTDLVNHRLGALETLLTALEETVGPAFEEVDLVQVDQGRFTADAYV
ncbi:MAG: hypothetical protein ACREMY_10225, partial [bacterium]